MKIDLKDIVLIFEKMQEELNISYVSIVIFAAVDVDSICTLKILSKMLRCENMQYKVYPVTSYSELGTRIEEARAYDKVKMFLFINCGGVIDLTEYWLVQQKQAQIFLFDINKPINHKNLESQEIKIIDDGFGLLEHCPTTLEIERYGQLNEYDLDDEDDDDDDDEQVSRAEDSPKRIKKRDFKEKLRKHKELIETKIAKYYGNQFFGYPSSYSAYRMVRDLEKQNNQYLWYAIVGATSMFLEQKISKDILDSITQLYRQDAGRFNPNELKRDKGGISVRKGFQFTLLEHWSLYESMLHSPYLMVKLRLWDPKGLNKLHQFIHHLEVSLHEARQLFKFMSREAQNKLENNIIPTAEKFGLHEVVYTSFIKQVDYSDAFTPADYHYALTSVLEAPPSIQLNLQGLGDHRVNCFWEAYDLFQSSQKALSQRLENYKGIVKILMKQTRNLLQRDHLIRMDRFSLVSLKNDTDDRKIFQHPATLIRLANLLMGVQWEKDKHRKQRKERGPLPVIASWMDMEREVSLVVGVNLESKNNLGNRFNEVAERLKIEVNHDSFMANIIMMKKESLGEFLREMGQV